MHIAVDLGAESGRVIAGDLENLDVMHRFPSRSVRVGGTLFWDALAIFNEIKTGLKEAFSRYGDKIESIGIDTWGVDYGLLDAQGNLLGNPFHYRDVRNDGMMEELIEKLGKERIYSATGIQFLSFNTIFQLYEEVKNRKERLAAADCFLTIPDLLHYWLCGEKVNEASNASTTQLVNPFTGDWDWDLIDEIGIPRKIFNKIVQPGTIIGELTEELQGELAAPSGVKIIAPACHDTGSAVAATPIKEGEPAAYLSSGTWSLLGIELPEALVNEKTREANFTNEGGVGNTFRFLKNIMGLWVVQQCRNEWKEGDDLVSYAKIEDLANESSSTGARVDINDSRFLKPAVSGDGMVARVQAYCRETGQPVPVGIGPVARVVTESLAVCYTDAMKQIEEITGKKLERLIVVGGGSKHRMLNQLTADLSGIPVSAGPVEATALGNILMQSLACGRIKSIQEGRDIIASQIEGGFFIPVK